MLQAGALHVYCVDPWRDLDHVYAAFRANTSRVSRLVTVQRCRSVDAANWWRLEPLDLVFIDADHSYAECLLDIKSWTPHVRPGGIICGHDITLGGVEDAVRQTGAFQKLGWSIWWRQL